MCEPEEIMLGELRTLLNLLGPRNLVRNAHRMQRARSAIRGYVTTSAYWSLMNVGFLDELISRQNVELEDFCRAHELDQTLLGELCTYLIRIGHFSGTRDRVSMTRSGKRFWRDVNGVFNIFCAYQPFFRDLELFLRGEANLASRQRIDERVALGFRETGANFTFAAMANLLQRINGSSIIELGCGNIDLSRFVCQRAPHVQCLGIDNDQRFLSAARETITREGLSDRVALLESDLFELTPEMYNFSPYDVVTAIDLFHGYYYEGRDRLLDLFRAIRETFSGQRFLVSEMCLPDPVRMRKIAYPIVEHELFHALTGQRTFAEGELEDLLEQAGFTILKRWSARNLAARVFLLFE